MTLGIKYLPGVHLMLVIRPLAVRMDPLVGCWILVFECYPSSFCCAMILLSRQGRRWGAWILGLWNLSLLPFLRLCENEFEMTNWPREKVSGKFLTFFLLATTDSSLWCPIVRDLEKWLRLGAPAKICRE